MLLSFALLLSMSAQDVPAVGQPDPGPASVAVAETEATASARRWLALVDKYQWQESWSATGATFRKRNTVAVWASVSKEARVPLGAVVTRTHISEDMVPAPPSGYRMVKFRTSFANKADVLETLSLVREGSEWRVVGYLIG